MYFSNYKEKLNNYSFISASFDIFKSFLQNLSTQ